MEYRADMLVTRRWIKALVQIISYREDMAGNVTVEMFCFYHMFDYMIYTFLVLRSFRSHGPMVQSISITEISP